MASAQEIRAELAKFLAHAQTLDALNEWLSRNTWNIHRESDSVRELVGSIELRLAEFSSGHCNQEELREQLAALLPNSRSSLQTRVAR